MNNRSKVAIAITTALTLSSFMGTTVFAEEQSATDDVEVIEITGVRSSMAKALQAKRFADSIQDSIVAEDMGKMPDQNVAESLQRITGVSISRANGEGSKVTIRGFGPQFNVVKMNDRTLATTGGDRSFDFQLLPSEMISGADVIKSPTAKLASGSIGGYINLHSARPLAYAGFHAAGTVKAVKQDLADEVNPEFSGIISNTFADDTIGILVGVSYKDTTSRLDTYRGSHWNEYSNYNKSFDDSWGYGFPMDKSQVLGEDGQPTTLEGSRGPGRAIFTSATEDRERLGANATIQWAPNENMMSTFDVLYSKLDREQLGSGLQAPLQTNKYSAASVSDSGTLLTATLANTDVEFLLDYSLEESTTEAYGYNFEYNQDNLTVTADLSYSKAETRNEGDNSTVPHYTRFNEDGSLHDSTISLDFSQGDVPSMSVTGMDLIDPSTVRAAWQRYSASEAEDTVKEAKLDAKYEFDSGVVTSIETGIAYSNRELSSDRYGTEFDPETGAETWNGAGMWIGDGSTWGDNSAVGLIDTSIFRVTEGNYMDGVSGDFPRQWLTVSSHQAYRSAAQDYLEATNDDWRSGIVDAGWDTLYKAAGGISSEETTKSAYVQVNLEGELGDMSWTGNIGGRYVQTDNESTGTTTRIILLKLQADDNQVKNTAETITEPTTAKSDDDYFLPTANFNLAVTDEDYVRLGLAKNITRPGLWDSANNFGESPGFANPMVYIWGGNPNLKPYEVEQLDLSYEHYGEHTSYSVAFFYKDITSFISQITKNGTWQGPVEQALRDAYIAEGGDGSIGFTSDRKENREGGTIQGLEFGAMHTFDYLPGFWGGFGIQANYTWADSEDKDQPNIVYPGIPSPSNALEGFAKDSYNFVGFYDQDGISVRLAYNYRGDFMTNRSGPGYETDYGQLDFSASYDFNENVTILLEGTNITDETRTAYYGQRDRVSYVELSGARYNLGVRATF